MAMRKVTTTTAEGHGGGAWRRLKAEILQLMQGRQAEKGKGEGEEWGGVVLLS